MLPSTILPLFVVPLLACGLSPFATSPLGRTQLKLFPSAEMDEMGALACAQMKSELPPGPRGGIPTAADFAPPSAHVF